MPKIGIDFGGTRIKAGEVQDDRIVRDASAETPYAAGVEAVVDTLANVVRRVAESPRTVGLAIPGEVDAEGRVWRLPNVPGFEGVAIGKRLGERLGCDVVVENDATTAALAENLFGHGRRHRSFLVATLGTGVGGGLVLEGRVRRGTHGFAAEIGHVLVDSSPDAWTCNCGNLGCMEAYAGTKALLRKFREHGGAGDDVRAIADSAHRGEEAGREAFRMMGTALGTGLATIQNVLDLDAVVFAGGISASFDLIEPDLRAALAARAFSKPLAEVPLLVSTLGASAGIVGAAHLASTLAGDG